MASGMPLNRVTDFSRVNQRLLQAKFLLQQARLQSQELLSPIQIEALINSVVWHLQSALQFYVRELAGYSKLNNAYQLNSLAELSIELQKQNKSSQAVDELIDLHSARGDWLYRLYKATQILTESDIPKPEEKAFAIDDNKIPLANLDEEDDLHLDDLEIIIREMTQLVQRQRLVLAEF